MKHGYIYFFLFILAVESCTQEPMVNEIIGLALSAAIVIGISLIAPFFHERKPEDEPDNRLPLNKLLRPLDFDLREAANGQEVVEKEAL
jgi:hypothetical protein